MKKRIISLMLAAAMLFTLTSCGKPKGAKVLESVGEAAMLDLFGSEKDEVIAAIGLAEGGIEAQDESRGTYFVTSGVAKLAEEECKVGLWFSPSDPQSFYAVTYDVNTITMSDDEIKNVIVKFYNHIAGQYGSPCTYPRDGRIQDMGMKLCGCFEYWLVSEDADIPAWTELKDVKSGKSKVIIQAELSYDPDFGRVRLAFMAIPHEMTTSDLKNGIQL